LKRPGKGAIIAESEQVPQTEGTPVADTTQVTALIKQIAGDEALRNKLTAASDADRAAIIADLGFADITPADIAAGASAFVPEMVSEIDESELASIAGGGDTVTTTTTTTTVTASASAAVAT
jgi:predicted ribosomally synthesized peptide with nif11-like leader